MVLDKVVKVDYALELTRVSKTYKNINNKNQKKALDEVSLKIPMGSIFGLLGHKNDGDL